MNENLNLIDILKDCSKGTKLYSTIHGEVEFEEIIINEEYPIKYKYQDKFCNYIYAASVSINGRYSISHNGECILFPSKDQRDWSLFSIEPKFNVTTLKPFDKVLVRVNDSSKWRCDIFSHICDEYYKFFCAGNLYRQCIPYNNETEHLIGKTEMPPKKYITWK